MFEDFAFDEFWKQSAYATKSYVEEPLTPELVASVEAELGFPLPRSYVEFMKVQNGGVPSKTRCPTDTATSWAEDHVAVTGFLGIGRTKTYSLLGELGSTFMQESWGYPRFGICICDCPSAGHDMIMLDYRELDPNGEPRVVHVDQERDFRVTPLAPNFESFVRALQDPEHFDTAEDDLPRVLETLGKGSFSTALRGLLDASAETRALEPQLRALLRAVASEKGYFALHADATSHLVYDVLFDLYARAHLVGEPREFLDAYPELIALGDGEVTTGGYAPSFVESWLDARLAGGQIERTARGLRSSPEHAANVRGRLEGYR